MKYKKVYLRSLQAGQMFLSNDGALMIVVSPGADIVRCRDSIFNLVWQCNGSAVVRVRL